jgi:hypothetical protein
VEDLPSNENAGSWARDISRTIRQQRKKARDFLRRQRDRFDDIERELRDQLGRMQATNGPPVVDSPSQPQDRVLDQLNVIAEQLGRDDDEADQTTSDFDSLRLENSQLRQELASLRDQLDRAQQTADSSLCKSRSDQEELRQRLAQSRQQLESRNEEIAELKQQLQDFSRRLAGGEQGDDPDDLLVELNDLREERRELLDRLAEAEVKARHNTSRADQEDYDELRRRFEMAVEDVREQKARAAQLEEKLRQQSRNSNAGTDDGGSLEGLDWEAQKKLMMARLEAEFDEDDEEEFAERMTMEGAIRITDEVVARKDEEIAALKGKIAKMDANRGRQAVSEPSETGECQSSSEDWLEKDAIVQQERESLRKLQEKWKQKIREAEIDIAVERAKITRERAELDDRIAQTSPDEPEIEIDTDSKSKKGNRGRWLSRLGLKEEE